MVLFAFPAILGMAKTAKFWVIAAVVASVIGGVTYFVMDYRSTLKQLAVSEEKVENLRNDLTKVNQQIQDERQRVQSLRQNNSQISSQYRQSLRKIQELQKNVEEVKANPTEAELGIKRSFNNFMNDVSCITGDSLQCPQPLKD